MCTSMKCSGGSRIFRRGGVDSLGGRGPPTWVLFGKNVCENERIGSCRGHAPGTPSRSANEMIHIGGSRGVLPTHAPLSPTGSNSFVFAHDFTKKRTCQREREILEPPLIHVMCQILEHDYFRQFIVIWNQI